MKRYALNELEIGMIVKESELSHIYDTRFLLTDSRLLDDGDVIGTLIYFGEDRTQEYTDLCFQGQPITPIYFNSEEYADGVVYDE